MIDVAMWLKQLGLERYEATFRDNEVTADVLPDLTEVDLEKLGLPLGPRKKLLKAIAALDAAPAAVEPSSAAPATMRSREAERRQLTVVFVDLVGSTALSARLDPEEMREIIRAYQNAVAGEIGRVDGHVAKFMGDGVLAYFGWPRAHEDEPERAVRAGLAIVSAVAKLSGGGETMTCRVGIATGLVVVGDLVGEGAAQEEAVVGDTPNLAARLQALAAPGQVVVADATRRLLGAMFEIDALGPQALKGMTAAVPAFAVRGERSNETRFAARAGASLDPLIGRDGELAVLLERWNAARAGQGQLVMLTGEAGIGKSRIVQALIDVIPGDHFRITFQCSPYHTDSSLYPAIRHFGRAAGFAADDTNDVRLDKLEALLQRAGGDIREPARLIAALLGLDGSARYGASSLTPTRQRARTLEVVLDQLIDLARIKPVLMVVEDAHWIDPTTLELIELALERVAHSRVLVLLTARPSFNHGFGGHPIVTRLSLNRLGRDSVGAIVGRITRGKPLPAALLEEIAARTDGIPLYVEEMTRALLESGMLRETASEWQLDAPLAQLAIPTSLHDSLMARLDRLQPVKEVAQTAAVIGRAFDHATLAALTPLPDAELAQALERLVEAELVFRRGVPPEARYLFKHALVRDAAYESLLKTRRQALHLRLLDILETGGATAPELLAYHAQEGGAVDKAVGYWRRAGAAAISRGAFEEAAAQLNTAWSLLPSVADATRRRHHEAAIAVLRGHASVVQFGYGHDQTMARFEEACLLTDVTLAPRLFFIAHYGTWVGHHVRDERGPALTRAQQFLDTAIRQQDSDQTMMGHRMLGTSEAMLGRLDAGLPHLERALEMHDPERHRALTPHVGHDPGILSRCYLALTVLAKGYPDRARALTEEARQWLQATDQVNANANALNHLCLVAVLGRETARAREFGASLIATSSEHGMTMWEGYGHAVVASCQLQDGDAAGAIERMPRALAAFDATRTGLFRPLWTAVMARALAAAGSGEATAMAEEAEAQARRSGWLYALAEIQRSRGQVLQRLHPDQIAAPEAAYRRALATAREQNARLWELRAAGDLGRLLAEQGRRSEAQELVAPLYASFTEGFATADLVETKALLEQLR